MFHFKGDVERTPQSQTAQKFMDSGTPFIGGASGTIEQIVSMMEKDKPHGSLPSEESNQREQIIALYSAMLVIGGNHSLMEGLLPAKGYGYFKEIPDVLESPEGYGEAMAAIGKRFPGLDQQLSSDPGEVSAA